MMRTAQISPGQLFCLVLLFMLGSAWLFGLGAEAKQGAWLVSLTGMAAGLPLIGLYLLLQSRFPGQTLVQYLPRVLGRMVGKWLALLYICYFLYIAARVTRDFTELVLLAILPRTPMGAVVLALVIVTAYGVRHGVEVLARVAQVLLPLGFVLILIASLMALEAFRVDNLLPVLEEGWSNIWKAAFPLAITVPFGETILFSMVWPTAPQRRTRWTLLAGAGAGLFLAYLSLVNIGVLGPHIVGTSQFPLLTLIHQVRLTDMVERLDAIVVVVLVVGGFMKISLFYYGAASGLAQWLGLADYRPVVLPLGTILAPLAMVIASSYAEHIEIGLKEVPYTLHLPAQVVVPGLVLVVSVIRGLSGKAPGSACQSAP